jgi:hypothetical protein
MNGSHPKKSLGVKTTLTRLKGSIPDVALKNYGYMLTMQSDSSSSNLDVSKMCTVQPKFVSYIDNSAFCSDPTTWNARSKGRKQEE